MSETVDAMNEWQRQQREAYAKLAAAKEARDVARFGAHADEGWRTFATDEPACWPKTSLALGVHPSQIPAAIEDARKNGIEVDFVREGPKAGDAILKSRKDRKRYAKMHGIHDKDGGYGDP